MDNQDIKFFEENELWKFTDPSGVQHGYPLGAMYYAINEEQNELSIHSINDHEWLFRGVKIDKILKSNTANDYYTDLAEFLAINESFFVKASGGGGGGWLDGRVSTYNDLPAGASHQGKFYLVEQGSGGFWSFLGVYEYPAGIYTPNLADIWELTPLKVKYAEDAFTVLNIPDGEWPNYFSISTDVNFGDRVYYKDQRYKNLTGVQSSTPPDLDTTNWEADDTVQNVIIEETITFEGKIVYGNSLTPPQIVGNQNNYGPEGIQDANMLRLSSTGNIQITGLEAPDPPVNQSIFIVNVGTNNIAFLNQNAASDPENRFLIGGNKTVQADEGIMFIYDDVSLRWRSQGINI